jgi:ABC-type transport system involved in multi-copper enzyme maturation permease subunit
MRGVATVARQEFRMRLRSGRWKVILAVWLAVVAGFTLLADGATRSGSGSHGAGLLAVVMFFVLSLVLVVTPALTAQSINGDRERGTLATLQVTRLRPAEIALGKLFAGWLVGLMALLLTVPFAALSLVRGGVNGWRFAVMYGVVALLMGVVCALCLAISASVARVVTSAVLSYVVVFALTVGTLLVYLMGSATVVTGDKISEPSGATYYAERAQTEYFWWVLAPNPFVVMIDAAPKTPPRHVVVGDTDQVIGDDPLWDVGRELREGRTPRMTYPPLADPASQLPPVWPFGLTVDVLLGVGAVVLTIRRLRAPVGRLPRGVRIA